MAKAMRIPLFAGAVPRAGRRQLSDVQAQVATNVRLTSGELAPLYDTALINDPDITGLLSIYKMTQSGTDYWLGWAADVNAAKGPIAGDATNRTYYTGDGEPRVTNYALATAGTPYPYSWYVLGVTPPVTAPSPSHAGGAGAAVSRTFVYTFVTQWGEESAPSPASALVTGKVDGTWTVASMDVAPLNSFATTAVTWSGGVLTVTVASTFGLRVGERMTLAGLAPAALNAAWTVATVTSTTFTVATADPGAITDQLGTATRIAPHNTGAMTKNIYWSETSSAGTAYQLVKSGVAVADVATTVAGNTTPEEELPTTDWPMPPADLAGLFFHPSGAAVGFSGNQVCFSEPRSPYAWPLAYRFTLDHDVVGVGSFGSVVVAGTKGRPYVLAGPDPESIGAPALIDQPWPCLSKRGLVSTNYGVMYPAPQGLAMIGPNGSEVATKELYTQPDWEALSPSSFRAAMYGNRYVASYSPGGGTRQLLIIDRTEFATVTTANKVCDALYGDQKTGVLYVVVNDQIREWDASTAAFMLYDWMWKEIVAPEVFNPGAAKLDADFSLTAEQTAALVAAAAATSAANQALLAAGTYDVDGSMSAVGEIEVGGISLDETSSTATESLQFQLWIDNELKYTKQVTSSDAFRLPSGYKANALSFRVTGNVRVLAVVLGETMNALRTV